MRRWIIAAAVVFGLCGPAQAADAPLAAAIRKGDRAGALELLAQKADVNAAEPNGTTPLHYAAYREGVLKVVSERWYRIPGWLPVGRCYFFERYGFR